MKSRERVLKVINHEVPDRIPIDFGGTVVTSMEYDAHKNLKNYLNIEEDNDPIIDYTMGTVEPCAQLKKMFESDFQRISLNFKKPIIKNNMYTDDFGIKYKKAKPHEYFDVVYNPLADAKIEDVDKMKLTDPDNPELYKGLKKEVKKLYEGTNYALVADIDVPGFYETSQKLRGYEQFACDLLINENFVKKLFNKLLKLQKKFFKNYLEQVGNYVQVIGYADDLGMQQGPQISPDLYRKVIKPYHKKIFKFIHKNTKAKILLHCCGSIFPLIEDLIEAGVDILNPVQTGAKNMDPVKLKKTFGDRLVFWGGIDVQELLPKGTKEDIKKEVKKMIDIMGKDGGYILAATHNIQNDTPPENVEEMFVTANRYREY